MAKRDIVSYQTQILVNLWNRASIPLQQVENAKTILRRFTEEASKASKRGKQDEIQKTIEKLKKFV